MFTASSSTTGCLSFFFFKEHKELRKEVELPDIFLFELCHIFST